MVLGIQEVGAHCRSFVLLVLLGEELNVLLRCFAGWLERLRGWSRGMARFTAMVLAAGSNHSLTAPFIYLIVWPLISFFFYY